MNKLVVTRDRNLPLCLKMLYDENVEFTIALVENSKGKIEYHVLVDVPDSKFAVLDKRYKILTS